MSSKIDVIKTLLEKADKVIIVGGMVFTFDKARGFGVRTLPRHTRRLSAIELLPIWCHL